ncbi:ABC transporter ATP-binding protein [Candidatus Leptofilum sp.]|uniref:ABC transporter ATP-binding protein n=1 Tax=Candidatus Leptofilum sp. TaxID=3241576 RepID=UPI003B596B3D
MSEFDVNRSQQTDQSTTGRWVLSHLSHHKLLLASMFTGAFGNAALAAAVPVLIGTAFDAALETPADLRTIGWMALGVIGSQSVRAVLQLGRNFSSAVMGERLERDMREELYISLLGKSTAFHDSQPVGDTMARATNDVHEVNLLMNPGINLVAGSANFMIMPLLVAPSYHPQLAAAPLFFIVTYVLAVMRYLRVLQGVADRVRRAFGTLNGRLAEAIDGIELVKGAAQETQEIGLFNQNATRYRDAAVDQGKIEARFLPLLLLGVTQGIGFAHALYLFNLEQIAVGDVVGYMGLLALFGFPTFISLLAYSRVSLGLAGARRILELMNAETLLDENAAGHQAEIVGEVAFDNVTFSYVAGSPVLQAIDFGITPGETVAIVGQTGAGKSTLAKLINRTYDVGNGRLLVDGIDVRDWNLAALRQQISIIEQDIFLFSRTVGENIAFGCPGATQEMIVEAAKAAQAHEFILNFKDGYETVIGERGVTLSGGQRQRLALARAFLTRPRILILDDSTSAVDSATEDQIQQAIVRAAANQTTILITHRLSQIRWADKVVVMRKGRMEAVGSHDELMASSLAYRRIFEQYEAIEE